MRTVVRVLYVSEVGWAGSWHDDALKLGEMQNLSGATTTRASDSAHRLRVLVQSAFVERSHVMMISSV